MLIPLLITLILFMFNAKHFNSCHYCITSGVCKMTTPERVQKIVDTYESMLGELKRIPVQLKKLETEHLQLTKDIEKFKDSDKNSAANIQRLKEANSEVKKLQKENETLQRKLENLSNRVEGMQIKRQEAGNGTSGIGARQDREKQLQEQLGEAKTQILDIQNELDDTKLRLSKALGGRLNDGNPDIADLSDKNRPTKLGERYSELYDNQWTDAFDVFDKQGMSERDVIKLLLKILQFYLMVINSLCLIKDTYDFCQKKSLEQMQNIIQAMLIKDNMSGKEVPSLRLKQYKDCRKEVGEESGKAVLEEYLRTLKYSSAASKPLQVQPYVKECVLLCWLMCLQDPPVVLDKPRGRGESFESEMYRAYTKNGKKIEFLVWPAMLLHKDGNVLCKGVAQCYDSLKQDYLDNGINGRQAWMETPRSSEHKDYTMEIVYPSRQTHHSGSARSTRFYDTSRNKDHSIERSHPRQEQSRVGKNLYDLETASNPSTPTVQSVRYEITDQDMDDFFFYRRIWSNDRERARNCMGKKKYDLCREIFYQS
ncbi:uncharacterized protein LOC128227638 isoform X1 [Mya arenaria]|uniref:uncharacterized protein LOC128227638 isoform X1 n=2 Tax=Mya arenaria TaxID=6604 RepID=UPI0022E2C7A5|nr:uncharacterized protein LOC128227638 isoform X1 [Mya arenaria]